MKRVELCLSVQYVCKVSSQKLTFQYVFLFNYIQKLNV